MNFGPQQEQLARRAAELAYSGLDGLASVLLFGTIGVGKGAVARAMADYLGLEFAHVPMNDTADALRQRLFGSPEQTRRAAEEESHPGEFGKDRPTLLYLDKLHGLDTELAQALQQAISQRSYFDAEGRNHRISGDLLIVASLRTFEPEARVTPEHFVCTAFSHRLLVCVPTDLNDLRVIATGMLNGLAPGRMLAADTDELLLAACHEPDHLHALSRWLRMADARNTDPAPIDFLSLQTARNGDVESLLQRVEYYGRPPTIEAFRAWQANFPEDLRPQAVVIIRQIVERYYIARERYWNALRNLISQARIASGQSVVFCKWQVYGKSNPTVMRHLKNLALWKPTRDLDITYPVEEWRNLSSSSPPKFVLVDDFTGSGNTLCSLWEKGRRPLLRLLSDYPRSKVYLLVVVGLPEGLNRVMKFIERYPSRVRLCVGIRLSDEDRCFANSSRVFPDPVERARMKAFCENIGEEYGFPPDMWFGYEESQALIVFPDAVPNNSLPILWHDQGRWNPLFPASGFPKRYRPV